MVLFCAIDRFDGRDWVVLEDDAARTFRVPRAWIPAEARERDVIRIETERRRLIAETCAKQGIEPGHLTLHADRGSSMRSKPVVLLLADLGVTRTHSRPHVSNDNPFSEAQFKTLKYSPAFPERFGSLEDGRAFGHVLGGLSMREYERCAPRRSRKPLG